MQSALDALNKAGFGDKKPKYKGSNDTSRDVPSAMQLQANIRHNAHDLQEYVSDLHGWTNEIAAKDKNPKLRDPYRGVRTF